MQWGLYLDKGDIHFTVIYDRDVFRAIEPYFDIQEIDEDIIVGAYEMQKTVPLPLKKDVSFLSEDLTIRVNERRIPCQTQEGTCSLVTSVKGAPGNSISHQHFLHYQHKLLLHRLAMFHTA